MTIERNFSTAATEFQRRFHISADNENRHRSSINQVILTIFFYIIITDIINSDHDTGRLTHTWNQINTYTET